MSQRRGAAKTSRATPRPVPWPTPFRGAPNAPELRHRRRALMDPRVSPSARRAAIHLAPLRELEHAVRHRPTPFAPEDLVFLAREVHHHAGQLVGTGLWRALWEAPGLPREAALWLVRYDLRTYAAASGMSREELLGDDYSTWREHKLSVVGWDGLVEALEAEPGPEAACVIAGVVCGAVRAAQWDPEPALLTRLLVAADAPEARVALQLEVVPRLRVATAG